MKYGETFKWDNIKSGLREGIKQGVGTVTKSATVVKTKTVDLTREGKRQIEALGQKVKRILEKSVQESRVTFPEQQTVFTPHFKEGPEDGFLRPFFCGEREDDHP